MLEKAVDADVMKALSTLGFEITRLQQSRRSRQTEGVPDLYASHAGWKIRVWLELKGTDGTVDPEQAAWHRAERAAGGTVLILRAPDHVRHLLAGLREMGAPTNPN